MNSNDHFTYDVVEIENRARRLRAEVTASAVRAAGRWLRRQIRRVGGRLPGVGVHRAA